jgi:hypothetical protein
MSRNHYACDRPEPHGHELKTFQENNRKPLSTRSFSAKDPVWRNKFA